MGFTPVLNYFNNSWQRNTQHSQSSQDQYRENLGIGFILLDNLIKYTTYGEVSNDFCLHYNRNHQLPNIFPLKG